MSDHELFLELLQRVTYLEEREKALTAASNVYQTIITTILGNLDQNTRDNIISIIAQAHEIVYLRALHNGDETQKDKIKQADDIAQRIFFFARGNHTQ